ncbi:hypothetical protein MKX01_021205, partial [Papaver californicum]
HNDIVSVFPDKMLELHATRSWDFLDISSGILPQHDQHYHNNDSDVIVGLIDSESPSFNDEGIEEIPSRWKGVCIEGNDFRKSDCNRKLIGARYYADPHGHGSSGTGSPRDGVSHGTHTASTTEVGGCPSSRLAIYKVFSSGHGCPSSAILSAFHDAIHDGVDIVYSGQRLIQGISADIISVSLGSSNPDDEYFKDPTALGALHAAQEGITVVCSAGNGRPQSNTVVNAAPWIITVGTSTTDRAFESNILLGNQDVIQGYGINIWNNLTHSKAYLLAFGIDVAKSSSSLLEASTCAPESLDLKKVAGKIISCKTTNQTLSWRESFLVDAQAAGIILVDDIINVDPSVHEPALPVTRVNSASGAQIIRYIMSTKILQFKPAPVVAYFSSPGPGTLTENIIKPDITAPGTDILASVPPADDQGDIVVGKPAEFRLPSGTSMSCPHVSGAAAFVKSKRPTTTLNNQGKPITNHNEAAASPHDMGARQLNPSGVVNPGLVYEIEFGDYIRYLCYFGYESDFLHKMIGDNLSCPFNSSKVFISDLNYPSISIKNFNISRTITRTLTNVGPKNSTYTVKVDSPTGLVAQVSPKTIVFPEELSKASFNVSFNGTGARQGYNYGSLTWSDGTHFVRSPFAVDVL